MHEGYTDVVAALSAQQDELSALIGGISDADWQRPSRCEGWTVADVVTHLVQTNRLATGSASGRFAETVAALAGDDRRGAAEAAARPASVDDAADAMVARERGTPAATIRERWLAGAAEMLAVLEAADPHQRVDWVAGRLSTYTLATTRLAEAWIHTGDVSAAFGIPPRRDERIRHIARLAWRTLPYAFGQAGRTLAGPVAFELEAPGGDHWQFSSDAPASTTIRGDALELCLVAGRRVAPADTSLRGDGPDTPAVLDLVRTYA